MKRVITITMDIGSDYQAKVSTKITEDEKPKVEWTVQQGVSTALVMVEQAKALLEQLNDYGIDCLRKQKEEQK